MHEKSTLSKPFAHVFVLCANIWIFIRALCTCLPCQNFSICTKQSLLQAKLTEHCPLSEKNEQKVCCFDDPNEKCHIPFGAIGEGTTHKVMAQLQADETPMKTYCFADEEAFVPTKFAYVLQHITNVTEATHLMERFGVKNGLDRMAFHLFNSIMPLSKHDCKTLFAEAG